MYDNYVKRIETTYLYQDKVYKVVITCKYQRGTYYRFDGTNFIVTAPRLTSMVYIKRGLDKFAGKLIQNFQKRNNKSFDIDDKWIYLFGDKHPLNGCNNENDVKNIMKKELLVYLNEKVPYYEELMGIKTHYKIHVHFTKTRYGSNSLKTHSLNFQADLVHFSCEIIDSVIFHELCHEFYRNHQKEFYDLLLSYCPKYYELKKKLNRRFFS